MGCARYGETIGSLEAGKGADMVLIDWDQVAYPYLDELTPTLDAVVQRIDRLYDVGRRKAEVVLTYGFLMQSAIIGVGLALIAGIAIGYARPRADPLRRPFLYVLVIWAAVTAYGAVFEAVAIKSGVVVGGSGLVNAPADIIWLDNDRRLVGAVVRSLDRGTIVRDASSGNLLFVPKDKINRTDLQSQP
jgi:hypothetical protein